MNFGPSGVMMKNKLIRVDSTEILGSEIRRKRLESKLTLEMAAPLCGVSVKFLQALETGKPTAQIEKSIHVAKMLGLSIFIKDL